jgi:hypothetical protein
MPFAFPTFGSTSRSSQGSAIVGVLGFGVDPSDGSAMLAGDILALPPFSVLGTTATMGFNAGFAPVGKTMLVVSVAGPARTCRSLVATGGGFASTHAEVSISIDTHFGIRPFPLITRRSLVRTDTSGPTTIFDDQAWFAAFDPKFMDGFVVPCTFGMPIDQSHFYVCRINLVQSVQAITGLGPSTAISNVGYTFPNIFFDFTN